MNLSDSHQTEFLLLSVFTSFISFYQFLQRLTIIKIEVFVLDAGSRMYMMMVSHTSGRVEENEWVF